MAKSPFFIAAVASLPAQSSRDERAAWNRPIQPFRIVGGIYYVGAAGIAVYLITTQEGAILLDCGFSETAPRWVSVCAT